MSTNKQNTIMISPQTNNSQPKKKTEREREPFCQRFCWNACPYREERKSITFSLEEHYYYQCTCFHTKTTRYTLILLIKMITFCLANSFLNHKTNNYRCIRYEFPTKIIKKVRTSELRKNYFGEQREWEWGIWRKTH